MAREQSSPGQNGAENVLRVLGLVDRTVLPRRLVLSNGDGRELVLLAARQCAALEGDAADAGTLARLASAIARFCAAGRAVTHRVEPLADAPAGYSAIAIVNAQPGDGAGLADGASRRYRFTDDGWPLAAPPDATFAALKAAASMARAMAGWRTRGEALFDGPALIVAVSADLAEETAISVGSALALTAAPPAQLGRIVSRWRSRSPEDTDGGLAD